MPSKLNPRYLNAVDQIYHFEYVAPLLLRIQALRGMIAALWPVGHPARLVHITGTAGKGSVARFLEAGLGLSGLTGGLYSPHLFDYRERFTLDGAFASAHKITMEWEERIRPLCLEVATVRPHMAPMFREINLLIALALFESHGASWGVIEAGLGVRYDLTRAIDPVATVITNVGDDHPAELGAARWQRALDKADIIRPGVPLFSAVDDPEAASILHALCDELGAPLIQVTEEDMAAFTLQLDRLRPALSADALLGPGHQMRNAALALRVVRHFYPDLAADEILKAFSQVRFAGRFEQVAEGVFIDVAHNPQKVAALAERLAGRFAGQKVWFLVGLSKGRLGSVLAPLVPYAAGFVVAGGFHEARDAEQVVGELRVLAPGIPVELGGEPVAAYQRALALRGADTPLVVTGSTFLVEQVFNPDPYLRHLNATYGWRAGRR